jgi:hypothetical protein
MSDCFVGFDCKRWVAFVVVDVQTFLYQYDKILIRGLSCLGWQRLLKWPA